jgi:hypothetical protein
VTKQNGGTKAHLALSERALKRIPYCTYGLLLLFLIGTQKPRNQKPCRGSGSRYRLPAFSDFLCWPGAVYILINSPVVEIHIPYVCTYPSSRKVQEVRTVPYALVPLCRSEVCVANLFRYFGEFVSFLKAAGRNRIYLIISFVTHHFW